MDREPIGPHNTCATFRKQRVDMPLAFLAFGFWLLEKQFHRFAFFVAFVDAGDKPAPSFTGLPTLDLAAGGDSAITTEGDPGRTGGGTEILVGGLAAAGAGAAAGDAILSSSAAAAGAAAASSMAAALFRRRPKGHTAPHNWELQTWARTARSSPSPPRSIPLPKHGTRSPRGPHRPPAT